MESEVSCFGGTVGCVESTVLGWDLFLYLGLYFVFGLLVYAISVAINKFDIFDGGDESVRFGDSLFMAYIMLFLLGGFVAVLAMKISELSDYSFEASFVVAFLIYVFLFHLVRIFLRGEVRKHKQDHSEWKNPWDKKERKP